MKSILNTLLLIILLSVASPAIAQTDFEDIKARAEAGDAGAQTNLGFMHLEAKNEDEAANWFRLAAEQGDLVAQDKIGGMYLYGIGVQINHQEALKWYRLAAEQGHAWSQRSIATMYEHGRGVPQNFFRAYIWYSLADATQPRGSESPLVSGAAIARDRMAAKLSPQALEQAQAQATRCFESNFKDCE